MEYTPIIPHLSPREVELKKLTTIIYALYALGFVVGITSVAALMVNYIKKDDVAGTFLASHFRWQIRTFWFGLAWGFLGFLTAFIGIGLVICAADVFWMVYRLVKGWLNLSDNKPMYSPQPKGTT